MGDELNKIGQVGRVGWIPKPAPKPDTTAPPPVLLAANGDFGGYAIVPPTVDITVVPAQPGDPLTALGQVNNTALAKDLLKYLIIQLLKDLLAGKAVDKDLLVKLLAKLESLGDPALKELVQKIRALLQKDNIQAAITELTVGVDEMAVAEELANLPTGELTIIPIFVPKDSRLAEIVTLKLQVRLLKERETALLKVRAENDPDNDKIPNRLDPATIADIDLMLGEIYANYGFIAEALGESSQEHFAKAEEYFTKAQTWAENKITATKAKAEIVPSWPGQIICRVNLWRAKILVVQSGRVGTLEDKNKLLAKAEGDILAALKLDKLKFGELSLLYQTWGDILAAQEKFTPAKEKYQKAIEENPDNYEAITSLGDVLNWGEDYLAALPLYTTIIDKFKTITAERDTAREKVVAARAEAAAAQQNLEKANKALRAAYLEAVLRNDRAKLALTQAEGAYQMAQQCYQTFKDSAAYKKAVIGRVESLLRSKDFTVVDQALAVSNNLLETETPGSFLLTRALGLQLEIAGAYLARGEHDKAIFYYQQIINRPLATSLINPREDELRLIKFKAQVGLAQVYADKEDEDKAEELFVAALKTYQTINKENLTLQESIQADLGKGEALFFLGKEEHEKYKEAIGLYNQLLGNPAVRLTTRMSIEANLGEIYTADWEGRDLVEAEKHFRTVVLQYYSSQLTDLSPLKKTIYARGLLGFAEMKRYGDGTGQKNVELSLTYYDQARGVIETITEKYREAKRLIAKSYFGQAKSHEVLGHKVEAQQASQAAHKGSAALLADERDDEARAYAKLGVDPVIARFTLATAQDAKGNTWTEHSYEVEVPVIATPNKEIALKIKDRVNEGKDITTNATYVTVETQAIPHTTVRTDFKIPGSDHIGQYKKGSVLKQFRDPDVTVSANVETELISANGQANLYYKDGDKLNTYHADLFFKIPAGRYFQFQLGPEVNYYRFPFESQFPARLELSPTGKMSVDLGGWFAQEYDLVRVGVMGQWVPKIYLDGRPDDKYEPLKSWGAGASLDVNLTYVIFNFNYLHKEDTFFKQDLFTFDLNLAPTVDYLFKKIRGKR